MKKCNLYPKNHGWETVQPRLHLAQHQEDKLGTSETTKASSYDTKSHCKCKTLAPTLEKERKKNLF